MANLSNINNKFLVTTGGNVGINVTGPTKKIDVYQDTVGLGAADFRHVNGNRILINPSYNYYDAYNHIFRGLNGTDTHMTIDLNGNVGIGEAAPESKLEISDTSVGTDPTALDSNFLMLTNKDLGTGAEVWGMGFNARSGVTNYLGAFVQAYGYFQTAGNTGLIFGTRNTSGVVAERMRIDDDGNVGIGTTAPSATEPTGGNLPTGWTRAGSKALEIAAPDFANSGLFLRNSGTTATGTDITGDQYFGDTYIDGLLRYFGPIFSG